MSNASREFEKEYAIREGERVHAENEYFKHRPQIDNTDRRRVFDAGFDRGYEAAQSRHASEREALVKDAERLAFIAKAERTVAGGKWCIQVLDPKGKPFAEYFDNPPAGTPMGIHPDRLTALRAAVDAAILALLSDSGSQG
ncbi:MAG: hypothetical protein ACR652_18650 [Methylocystis sp.]|uniref:hypothetical protein n=1 Tax=Methylocystis sp. TaxID=1911079 RepID=UPI003DA53F73